MFSLRILSTRASRLRPYTIRSLHHRPLTRPSPSRPTPFQTRTYASKTPADALIETITEQYSTARDEFEIATFSAA